MVKRVYDEVRSTTETQRHTHPTVQTMLTQTKPLNNIISYFNGRVFFCPVSFYWNFYVTDIPTSDLKTTKSLQHVFSQ